MVEYSPRAAQALAFLKQHYNDIDIFVEDTANHNMWLVLLRKVLPSDVKLESVNMLGGRGAVEEACRLDQQPTGRQKLYVIDADLDFLLDKPVENLNYFYRLKANNIENLLLDNNALIEMALEHSPEKTPFDIYKDLDFENQILQMEFLLRPLFVAYAVTQDLNPSVQTTKFSVKKLIKNTRAGAELDAAKVKRRIVSLYIKNVRKCGIEAVREMRKVIANRSSSLPLSQIASGKDYILPLVMLRFQAVCGYPRGPENFKVALARSYRPEVETAFAQHVASLAA